MPRIETFLLLPLTAAMVFAQTVAPGSIQATGTATINVAPDQVQLQVSVVTLAATAAQAGQQNAAQTAATIAALNQVLGKNGNVQTIGYSLYPRYSNTAGQSSTIVGYTAQNTLLATAFNDLTLAGPLIDAANQAGASSVGGLTFGLQDPDPARLQALGQAAKQAEAHAAAIASGVGGKAGSVISAVESVSSGNPVVFAAAGVASTTTPVITGTVSVTATVTVTVALQ